MLPWAAWVNSPYTLASQTAFILFISSDARFILTMLKKRHYGIGIKN